MAWDEKNRDEWAKRYLEQLARPSCEPCDAKDYLQGDGDTSGGDGGCKDEWLRLHLASQDYSPTANWIRMLMPCLPVQVSIGLD